MMKFESTAPLACALAAALLCGASGTARAQRNGEVYDFRSHAPTAGGVQSRERAAGDAPSPADERREARTVDQLQRELLQGERADGSLDAPADRRSPPPQTTPANPGAPPAAASARAPRHSPDRRGAPQ